MESTRTNPNLAPSILKIESAPNQQPLESAGEYTHD